MACLKSFKLECLVVSAGSRSRTWPIWLTATWVPAPRSASGKSNVRAGLSPKPQCRKAATALRHGYLPFPDPGSFRIKLNELTQETIRERLKLVWTAPLSLDPTRRSARVTRELAARLAKLAVSLEASDHPPAEVAGFLMRSLFTMFAEDVDLLPRGSFQRLLESIRGRVAIFPEMVREVWEKMDVGGFSTVLREKVHTFNGGLFADQTALALSEPQLELLIEAAHSDWKDVEPAIFGTLLGRALDPYERHSLGAHYTPRAYVERLVFPTVIEPLRAEWEDVKATAVTLAKAGKLPDAIKETQGFHKRLCSVRVLDPACGSGNFLYVTLEHLKRLEGEVIDALVGFGDRQGLLEMEGSSVDPHQFLGIEVNPRAAAIAEMVLWIGYLQWHFRTRGRTMKAHAVTGKPVPDETARLPVYRYENPHPAKWPDADYVVGNPPFIGPGVMREALGEGYAQALRGAHNSVPESVDFVVYWWNHAAELARTGKIKRFGFIATNSLRQTFNRRVIQGHFDNHPPLSLALAIPDHPWVDSADGAAVRISMTVGVPGVVEGRLVRVTNESEGDGEGLDVRLATFFGRINSDLTVGANVTTAHALRANAGLSCRGVSLHGAGFIVTPDRARKIGLGRIQGLDNHIRLYRNGRDLTSRPRQVMVIDLFGLDSEEVRSRFPEVYQHVIEHVKPERDQNNRDTYKNNWWIFGEPRRDFRPALVGLSRYIATVETSKHRFFVFLDATILPDNMLVNIALDDPFFLGVLSSKNHIIWALASGGTLEDRPRYNKSRCFEPFPFPTCDDTLKARIRDLGERLDVHRKKQLAEHASLTMTDMYNVLVKIRWGETLNAKDKLVHEQGLISILRELHDELDLAVAEAYGWPHNLSEEEILQRLVSLNRERAAAEDRGQVHWIRPEFQVRDKNQVPIGEILDNKPQTKTEANETKSFDELPTKIRGKPSRKTDLTGRKRPTSARASSQDTIPARPKVQTGRQPWPKALLDQVRGVAGFLSTANEPLLIEEIARAFKGARIDRVTEILDTLVALGRARRAKGRPSRESGSSYRST